MNVGGEKLTWWAAQQQHMGAKGAGAQGASGGMSVLGGLPFGPLPFRAIVCGWVVYEPFKPRQCSDMSHAPMRSSGEKVTGTKAGSRQAG